MSLKSKLALCAVFSTGLLLTAAVKSNTGQISFRINSSSAAAMQLNSTGLAVGAGLTPAAKLDIAGNAIISKEIYIGGNSGSSNLNINGTLGFSAQTIATSTNISSNSLNILDTRSGNLRISLPQASTCEGRFYQFKKTSALNNVYIHGGPFDDQPYLKLSTGAATLPYLSLISSSGNWYITAMSGNSSESSAANLQAWWTFDESNASSARDSSSYSNSATLNNMNFGSNGNTGILDQALDFVGGNNSLSVAGGNFQFGTEDFSVALWLKTSSNTRQFVASTYSGSSADSFTCEINASGKPTFQLYSAGTDLGGSSSTSIKDGQWHHVAWVFNRSGNAQIYSDGVINGTQWDISGVTSINNNNKLSIGKFLGNTQITFIGSMDDLRVYNKALSPSEVRELYQLAKD
jgi:hypothetical protein